MHNYNRIYGISCVKSMLIAVAKWGITINTLFYVNRLSFFFLLYPLYSLPLSRENSEAWREREREG